MNVEASKMLLLLKSLFWLYTQIYSMINEYDIWFCLQFQLLAKMKKQKLSQIGTTKSSVNSSSGKGKNWSRTTIELNQVIIKLVLTQYKTKKATLFFFPPQNPEIRMIYLSQTHQILLIRFQGSKLVRQAIKGIQSLGFCALSHNKNLKRTFQFQFWNKNLCCDRFLTLIPQLECDSSIFGHRCQ